MRLLIFLIISFVSSIVDAAQFNQQQLEKFVKHWRAQQHITGMALTVSSAGSAPVTITSGYQSRLKQNPITKNTLFQIGSITKTFVAVAILQQVAAGKISLHEKIGRWFPEYPRWKNITIWQLLNMTSGIYRYMYTKQYKQRYAKYPKQVWTNDELIELAYQHSDYAKPGTEWHYSNTNYLILGMILEKVTQQSLAGYFEQHFFKPLSLQQTFYTTKPYSKQQLKNLAKGYHNDKDVTNYSMTTYAAAGAMLSTSLDIQQWIQAIFNSNLLPKQQRQELLTTVAFDAPPKPPHSCYGLGLYYSYSKQYGDMWWYSGVTNGYISLFLYLPTTDTMITATINTIQGENYWIFMPNNSFVKQLLVLLMSK